MNGKNPFYEIEGASRWLINSAMRKPWAISIEITHNCTANCGHCDKGELIPGEKQATAEEYRKIADRLKPLVVQVSGGEPLMRPDVLHIVRTLKNPGRIPYLVLATNASLLDEAKYEELKQAGLDELSVSLDFPDSRHDENRQIPGLFSHLDSLIPKLAARGRRDITMITAVTSRNYPHLMEMVGVTKRWGVRWNLSMYTAGRTNDHSLSIAGDDLKPFRHIMDQVIEEARRGANLFSTEPVLNRYYDFFANGCRAGGCQAGIRSLVVNPDGSLCPCAMKKSTAFQTHEELRKKFSAGNTCDECFISLRANTEKPFAELVRSIRTSIQSRGQS
jgi:MoaA/NifB/PqqE/SkfB family radical SAM enzyme